ncbi:hypothetical protein A2U01_0013759, partial [Trifolium medium]|nr:hypothetical protein [Trifolium medium]
DMEGNGLTSESERRNKDDYEFDGEYNSDEEVMVFFGEEKTMVMSKKMEVMLKVEKTLVMTKKMKVILMVEKMMKMMMEEKIVI